MNICRGWFRFVRWRLNSKGYYSRAGHPGDVEPKSALIAALVAGSLAVAIVAADTAWSLRASLEAMEDGAWTPVAGRSADFGPMGPGFDCVAPALRLVVDNDKPFPDTVDVHVSYTGANQTSSGTLLDEAWSLGAFELRTYEFTLPGEAFEGRSDGDQFEPTPFVTATVGDEWLSTCVRAPAEG